MSAADIDRAEWDFSDLPASELANCFDYELAREAEAANWRWWTIAYGKSRSPAKVRSAVKAALADRSPELIRKPNDGASLVAFMKGRVSYSKPKPWRDLTAKERLSWGDQASERRRQWSRGPVAVLTAEQFDGYAQRKEWLGPWPVGEVRLDGVHHIEHPDGVTLALYLDLENSSNPEILRALEGVIDHLRAAAGLAGPGKAGSRVSVHEGNLRNLSIMRVCHAMPMARVMEVLSGTKYQFWLAGDEMPVVLRKADDCRQRIRKHFRERFSYLFLAEEVIRKLPELSGDCFPECYWGFASARKRLVQELMM